MLKLILDTNNTYSYGEYAFVNVNHLWGLVDEVRYKKVKKIY